MNGFERGLVVAGMAASSILGSGCMETVPTTTEQPGGNVIRMIEPKLMHAIEENARTFTIVDKEDIINDVQEETNKGIQLTPTDIQAMFLARSLEIAGAVGRE